MKLKIFVLFAALFVLAVCASAQTAPPSTSTGFSAETDAMGIYYNGAWSVGSILKQNFDLVDWGATKDNHLFIQGNQLLAPTPGINVFTGGFEYQPSLGTLFSKTNIPANTIQLFIDASAGVGTISGGTNHVSFMGGAGLRYNLNSSLTWNSLQGTYTRLGTQNVLAISTGLTFIFGPKASQTQIAAARSGAVAPR